MDNIHAVILWVIKNANEYLDAQLVETFERMVEKANVRNYKSNKRPFTWDRWRYNSEKSTHFSLEYRLVLQSAGGIETSWDGQKLSDGACEFLGDLLTVARNLGFHCKTSDDRLYYHQRRDWRSNQLETFEFISDKREVLFEVRAFKNRNIHLRMHQRFALALNVEYGRLKGWLKTGNEAAVEIGDIKAKACFKTNHALPLTGDPRLLLLAA